MSKDKKPKKTAVQGGDPLNPLNPFKDTKKLKAITPGRILLKPKKADALYEKMNKSYDSLDVQDKELVDFLFNASTRTLDALPYNTPTNRGKFGKLHKLYLQEKPSVINDITQDLYNQREKSIFTSPNVSKGGGNPIMNLGHETVHALDDLYMRIPQNEIMEYFAGLNKSGKIGKDKGFENEKLAQLIEQARDAIPAPLFSADYSPRKKSLYPKEFFQKDFKEGATALSKLIGKPVENFEEAWDASNILRGQKKGDPGGSEGWGPFFRLSEFPAFMTENLHKQFSLKGVNDEAQGLLFNTLKGLNRGFTGLGLDPTKHRYITQAIDRRIGQLGQQPIYSSLQPPGTLGSSQSFPVSSHFSSSSSPNPLASTSQSSSSATAGGSSSSMSGTKKRKQPPTPSVNPLEKALTSTLSSTIDSSLSPFTPFPFPSSYTNIPGFTTSSQVPYTGQYSQTNPLMSSLSSHSSTTYPYLTREGDGSYSVDTSTLPSAGTDPSLQPNWEADWGLPLSVPPGSETSSDDPSQWAPAHLGSSSTHSLSQLYDSRNYRSPFSPPRSAYTERYPYASFQTSSVSLPTFGSGISDHSQSSPADTSWHESWGYDPSYETSSETGWGASSIIPVGNPQSHPALSYGISGMPSSPPRGDQSFTYPRSTPPTLSSFITSPAGTSGTSFSSSSRLGTPTTLQSSSSPSYNFTFPSMGGIGGTAFAGSTSSYPTGRVQLHYGEPSSTPTLASLISGTGGTSNSGNF